MTRAEIHVNLRSLIDYIGTYAGFTANGKSIPDILDGRYDRTVHLVLSERDVLVIREALKKVLKENWSEFTKLRTETPANSLDEYNELLRAKAAAQDLLCATL